MPSPPSANFTSRAPSHRVDLAPMWLRVRIYLAGLLSGVKESRRDISIQPTTVKEELEQSRSFPGLRTQYRLHHMDALVGGLPWGAFETEVFDEIERDRASSSSNLFIRSFKSSAAKKDSQKLKHKSLWEWGTEDIVVTTGGRPTPAVEPINAPAPQLRQAPAAPQLSHPRHLV